MNKKKVYLLADVGDKERKEIGCGDSHETSDVCWYNSQSISIYDCSSLSLHRCSKTHVIGRMTFS
jgi:hypothetical protein